MDSHVIKKLRKVNEACEAMIMITFMCLMINIKYLNENLIDSKQIDD
jgi:hypothetical protein